MRLSLVIAATLLFSTPVLAAMPAGDMPPGDSSKSASAHSPADLEFMASMAKMHADMDVKMTGDPDHDFVAMMLPHHQGAVDMARTELKYGKDEQLRAMARQIIAAQDKEMAFMRRWQTKHGEKHAE